MSDWFTIPGTEVQAGDLVRTGPGPDEVTRVRDVLQPTSEWSRAFEVTTWVEVGEDDWFDVHRPDTGQEVEY